MLKTVSSITNAIGALNYKGTWDANANSPALASSVGTKGDYYVVSTAGSTNLNGITNWGVGDLATFNGSVWQRVEGGADGNFENLSFNAGYGSVAPAFGCRAWAQFDGTAVTNPGSMTGVRGSGNVASVTDLGVGQYRVTFTNVMPDRNYCAIVSAGYHQGATVSSYSNNDQYGNSQTTHTAMMCLDDGGTFYDPDWVNLVVFR